MKKNPYAASTPERFIVVIGAGLALWIDGGDCAGCFWGFGGVPVVFRGAASNGRNDIGYLRVIILSRYSSQPPPPAVPEPPPALSAAPPTHRTTPSAHQPSRRCGAAPRAGGGG